MIKGAIKPGKKTTKLTERGRDYIRQWGGKVPDEVIAKSLGGITRSGVGMARRAMGIAPYTKVNNKQWRKNIVGGLHFAMREHFGDNVKCLAHVKTMSDRVRAARLGWPGLGTSAASAAEAIKRNGPCTSLTQFWGWINEVREDWGMTRVGFDGAERCVRTAVKEGYLDRTGHRNDPLWALSKSSEEMIDGFRVREGGRISSEVAPAKKTYKGFTQRLRDGETRVTDYEQDRSNGMRRNIRRDSALDELEPAE